MKWDVFISYASEDKPFVCNLAFQLKQIGLRVWFDADVLQPGDSLRRSIDEGLSKSRHGIVVLSKHFFSKEWPQKELDGLVAQEDGKRKVIIPVWYEITAEQVATYSPLMAGRFAIQARFSDRDVVEKIVRALYADIARTDGWKPFSLPWPDGVSAGVKIPI